MLQLISTKTLDTRINFPLHKANNWRTRYHSDYNLRLCALIGVFSSSKCDEKICSITKKAKIPDAA